jgi:hypothetical protein
MYTLIADCSNFTLEHGICIADAAGEIVAVTHLPLDEIAKYAAADSRIDSIKLSGPTEYCMGIKEEIENKLALEYADRNINVEVL